MQERPCVSITIRIRIKIKIKIKIRIWIRVAENLSANRDGADGFRCPYV